jgi:hypothetical protein
MQLSDQLTSLELSKRLVELGVKQDSFFYWQKCSMCNDDWHLSQGKASDYKQCSAYTVAELGELLPSWINGHHLIITKSSTWFLRYRSPSGFIPKDNEPEIEEVKEADARAKMLIYLIEQGMIEVGK